MLIKYFFLHSFWYKIMTERWEFIHFPTFYLFTEFFLMTKSICLDAEMKDLFFVFFSVGFNTRPHLYKSAFCCLAMTEDLIQPGCMYFYASHTFRILKINADVVAFFLSVPQCIVTADCSWFLSIVFNFKK